MKKQITISNQEAKDIIDLLQIVKRSNAFPQIKIDAEEAAKFLQEKLN